MRPVVGCDANASVSCMRCKAKVHIIIIHSVDVHLDHYQHLGNNVVIAIMNHAKNIYVVVGWGDGHIGSYVDALKILSKKWK